MFRRIVLLVGGLASLSAGSLLAQDAVLGQRYGAGVHAYFSGDYVKAFEQLTSAIKAGSTDPRAFYFRGLAYLQLGRSQEAAQDFKKGSELESKDSNKFYSVSKALERVQGPSRVTLENYRVEARLAALEQAEKLRKARYEAIQREESRVLRQESFAPEAVKTPEPAAAPPAAEVAPEDLFGAPEEKAAEKGAKKLTRPGKKAEAADEAAGAKPAEAAAGEDNPFTGPGAKPAGKADAAKPAEGEKQPAAEPAAKADDANPFVGEPAAKPAAGKKGGLLGAMSKALGKAIGGGAPAKKGTPATPPAAGQPAAGEKPTDEKAPAEKKASEDNPFGS
jgi:hypothetical protein